MKHCDIYVQPSRHEGYCITVVEARVLCLSTLISNIHSLLEQSKDGLNGYVVNMKSKEIARKIEWLYMNSSLKKQCRI